MTCRCGYANTPPDPDQNRDEGDARSSSTARAAFWYILLLSVPFCLVAFPIFLVSVSTLQNKKTTRHRHPSKNQTRARIRSGSKAQHRRTNPFPVFAHPQQVKREAGLVKPPSLLRTGLRPLLPTTEPLPAGHFSGFFNSNFSQTTRKTSKRKNKIVS